MRKHKYSQLVFDKGIRQYSRVSSTDSLEQAGEHRLKICICYDIYKGGKLAQCG